MVGQKQNVASGSSFRVYRIVLGTETERERERER